MSTESGSNPNQGFENFAKLFELRTELLKVSGEWAKNVAEADLISAQALHERERVRTTAEINKALRLRLARIEKQEREFEKDKEEAERRFGDLNEFRLAEKPQALSTFYQRLDSLKWALKQGGDSKVQFTELPEACRTEENYISVSQKNQVSPIPISVKNLAQLIVHMRKHLLYPAEGSATHELLDEALTKVAAAQDTVIAKHETAIENARKGNFEVMHELLPFLKLDKST